MNPLLSILEMRLHALRNQVENLRRDSLAKVFVVCFGLANVIGIGFWVSFESFTFIETFYAFGPALNAKMVSLLFFALLILVILSTIIVTYTTIFLAQETEFFFHHPISPRTIFFMKLVEAMVFSSWATLFLCLPVLVAFGWVRRVGASYYAEAAAILTLFVLFAGFMGTVISILLAPLVRRLSTRQLLLASGGLLALLGWIFLRSFNFWDMDGENNLLVLDRFTAQFAALHSPYSPSHWAASAVLAAAAGNHAEVLFQGSTLLANTLIFIPLLSWYGLRRYGWEWLLLRGSGAGKELRGSASRRRALAPLPASSPAAAPARGARARAGRRQLPLLALMWKDILIFIRDPAQLSQSILFLLLMVIYSLSLVRIPAYFTTSELRLLIYFANLGAVTMILSSFTSRFLFPLISLEGKAFWIIGLAPILRADLVKEKALLGLGISLGLGLLVTVVSNTVLHSPPALFWGAVLAVVLAATCLTALATGLGAAYPLFEEDNPARIAVGLGGTLNFFASALAVALILGIEATPYLIWGKDPGLWILAAHGLALAFTAALALFCFRLGSRSLARREF